MSQSQSQSQSQGYFPWKDVNDGWSTDHEASATCFCGEVQLSFPTDGPDMVGTFVCNCTDCRKITASMFASNFIVNDSALKHVRGRDTLTRFAQSKTIATGNEMANYFCSKCGTLMYRVSGGYPGKSILRIGTVDDYTLHETKLKPKAEQFIKDRVNWLDGVKGLEEPREAAYY
jgi:hypothetical protein